MATTITTQPTDAEWKAAIAGCTRFLRGHGVRSPKDVLTELAAATEESDDFDMYGAGETVAAFEREVAALLGKEAAVFLPTGTMAQQIALRIWAERSGTRTVAFHPMCHVESQERKGYQLLHGLHAHLVGDAKRLMTLADWEAVPGRVAAALWELPQRDIGGELPQWDDLLAQTAFMRGRGAAIHMDGARLWESAPFYGRSYDEVSAPFDSVYVSFYKGVGALAGSALAGDAAFVAEARLWQKRHGGSLVHVAPLVLSARHNLRARLPRFPAYHERAVQIATVLSALPGVRIKPDPPQTHMMHVYLEGDADRLTAAAHAFARDAGLLLFQSLRPTDVPGLSFFELSTGDGALALTDDDIRDAFARLMAS